MQRSCRTEPPLNGNGIALHEAALGADADGFSNSQGQQVESMSAVASHAMAILDPEFPAGVDVHWETETRVVWNERERTSEDRELVYEVSWIAELGAWRRFLRAQRKVKG